MATETKASTKTRVAKPTVVKKLTKAEQMMTEAGTTEFVMKSPEEAQADQARKRAAKDWVTHYMYIRTFIDEMTEADKLELTENLLAEKLLGKWQEKAETKNTKLFG